MKPSDFKILRALPLPLKTAAAASFCASMLVFKRRDIAIQASKIHLPSPGFFKTKKTHSSTSTSTCGRTPYRMVIK